MKTLWVAIFGGLSITIGTWTFPAKPCAVRHATARAQASAAMAYAALYVISSTPDPELKPEPIDRGHPRESCPDGGWITHGDGHTTRCPLCRPAYTTDELKTRYFYRDGQWWYYPEEAEQQAAPPTTNSSS